MAGVQSMITIVAAIDPAQVDAARALIDHGLGNPAHAGVAAAIAPPGAAKMIHFASLHAIRSHDVRRGFLVLELAADGDAAEAVATLASRAGAAFLPVFRLAEPSLTLDALGGYWRKKMVALGQGLFQHAGLAFAGTPGKSVTEIDREHDLAKRIAELLSTGGAKASALAHLAAVKTALAADDDHAWALAPAPPTAEPRPAPTSAKKLAALAPSLITTFLWPILVVVVPLACWLAWPVLSGPGEIRRWLLFALYALSLVALGTILAIALFYVLLRRAEQADPPADIAPTLDADAAMFAHENAPGYAHNHMLSHTVRKPGWLRYVTARLGFWAIGRLSALNPKPGHLGEIGTIHFARWVTIPGTRDVLFLSNYGGSWESYLEDFITKAHEGLTAAWSNSIGFPRTRNLFQDGATDGERFKRFARESMHYTPFWYSAYPTLTTDNIRANASIRRGLAARTESAATEWLALFGSRPRPPGKLDTTQIQSIVFGGLGFKPEGRLVTVRLGDDVAANQRWLTGLAEHLSFNDGRYIAAPAVATLALTPQGLTRLSLPADALATFPAAFLLGMRGEGRARVLGDDPDARDWWWDPAPVDAALLIYGDTAGAVATLAATLSAMLPPAGEIVDTVDLAPVEDRAGDRREPFGFVDGVSQPAIRGTYRGLRNADPIHLVEPGELIVGYPDNRGGIPPGPTMAAAHDPAMMLPLLATDCGEDPARSIGFNGSYLVIRQLEQDADAFWRYCDAEADRFAGRFPDPAIADAEFIAAKMIGRWQDGSSLVRNPYMSASRLRSLHGKDAATMREKSHPADEAATPIDPGDRKSDATVQPDNDFLFGTEDPQGLRCPFGAHVRRANPRDSLGPGSMEQVGITNRHRILRIGRGFPAQRGRRSGLMFMCLNGDLERQFEFVQQTWMASSKFHGLDCETDVIAVDGVAGRNGFTIPVRTGPVALSPLPRFVTLRGGGYFFVPGRQLLRYLQAP